MIDTRVLINQLYDALVSQVRYTADLKNESFDSLQDDKAFITNETKAAYKLFIEWRTLVSKIEPRQNPSFQNNKTRISRVKGRIIQG